jgi:protein required for attachment to host cells
MENNLGITLVAVISSVKMILYEAKGIKIIKELEELPIVFEKHHHHTQEKKESHYQKKSTPGSLFQPHSAPQDIEYHEAAKNAADILEKTIKENLNYKRLIIVAGPKILGYIRHSIDNCSGLLSK